jgi:hypothetical protein
MSRVAPSKIAVTVLDPANAWDAALIEIHELHVRKSADYAADDSEFSNFEDTAELLGLSGFEALEAAIFNCAQKMVRLKSLRRNGRLDEPENESVQDTYRDLAVYSVIALVLSKD